MFNTTKKYIFTHPMRCAGTSIELALDAIPLNYIEQHDEEIKENGKTGMFVPALFFKHEPLSKHIEYLLKFNENVDEYFIFSCVRNPWDRAVSRYYFDITFQLEKNMSFDEYIKLKYKTKKIYNILSFKEFAYYNEQYLLKDIIKFESLQEDFERVCEHLSLPANKLEKICFHNKRPNTKYQEYYTNLNTKNMVEEMGKDSIQMFGYKFD